MKQQKLEYLSPETETLVVRFEGMICVSNPAKVMFYADWGTDNAAGGNYTEDAGYDL